MTQSIKYMPPCLLRENMTSISLTRRQLIKARTPRPENQKSQQLLIFHYHKDSQTWVWEWFHVIHLQPWPPMLTIANHFTTGWFRHSARTAVTHLSIWDGSFWIPFGVFTCCVALCCVRCRLEMEFRCKRNDKIKQIFEWWLSMIFIFAGKSSRLGWAPQPWWISSSKWDRCSAKCVGAA